ncbi:kinase-like domain-containing protein [Mycena epipterygia]|nr:kinase-like domain-containing protein [Mycena epipterygia]
MLRSGRAKASGVEDVKISVTGCEIGAFSALVVQTGTEPKECVLKNVTSRIRGGYQLAFAVLGSSVLHVGLARDELPPQRASHQLATSVQEHKYKQEPDVYSHPAAIAWAATHPRRTITKFGPYLLLQTLGEGEFGKVKFGLHCQWGEEVAVKLVRKENGADAVIKMRKVEKEIGLLKTLNHPNVVHIYDVIETDKYVGIILQYASGGELFDHILAHRYLREADASKLFCQLISGVWYIHQKKIRNIIITDFGSANRSEHHVDDLLQTSCGSPCYAAPELVISEGLYVGSAVDIWSCGVILYAMLAGYLPFDDDPANPNGDNINLLYKYITNTPLSFPEYISDKARDLLKMMLVPDPSKRASLADIVRHSWLAAYHVPATDPDPAAPTAFGRTVDELERASTEQLQAKHLPYQRQIHAPAPGSPNASSAQTQTRVQAENQRSRSAHSEFLYEAMDAMPRFGERARDAVPQLGEHALEEGEEEGVLASPPKGKEVDGVLESLQKSAVARESPRKGEEKEADKFQHRIQIESVERWGQREHMGSEEEKEPLAAWAESVKQQKKPGEENEKEKEVKKSCCITLQGLTPFRAKMSIRKEPSATGSSPPMQLASVSPTLSPAAPAGDVLRIHYGHCRG